MKSLFLFSQAGCVSQTADGLFIMHLGRCSHLGHNVNKKLNLITCSNYWIKSSMYTVLGVVWARPSTEVWFIVTLFC